MCIIMLDTRDSEERIDRAILNRCRIKNEDGMGIMYARGGKLHVWTTMKDINGIWNRYTHARDHGLTVAIHFRIGTKGTTTLENCHPFYITSDFAFMHNGTIGWAPTEPKDVSDTRFIRDVFTKLPGDFLQDPGLRGMVRDSITGDRMVFMDADGNHDIINEISGFWHKGTWKGGGVWFSHNRTKEFIIHGYEWKSPAKGSITSLTHWEGDGVRGHTKTCRCHTCERQKHTDNTKSIRDVRTSGLYKVEDHGPNCVCRYCLDDRSAAWHKRVAKEREDKLNKEVRPGVDHDIITLFPSHTDLYNKRAYPAPKRTDMPRFLFAYGRFRDDLGAVGIPENATKAGTGILLCTSLWVNEMESLGDIPGALIEPDNSEMYIHGMIYRLNGSDEDVLEQLKGLDEGEGCVYGDPQASTYHRFLMPVLLANPKEYTSENKWCWAYMTNPDSAINTLLGPVVVGDWAEYLADKEADIPAGDFDKEGWSDVKLLTSGDDGPELSSLLTSDDPLDEGRFACPHCLGMNTLSTKRPIEVDDDTCGLFGVLVHTTVKALYCIDCCRETTVNLPD